jgi:hypothetical protein
MTKTEKVRLAIRQHRWYEALKIAAKFRHLGEHKATIERAWAAYSNPRFYQEMGQNPDELIRLGQVALMELYS